MLLKQDQLLNRPMVLGEMPGHFRQALVTMAVISAAVQFSAGTWARAQASPAAHKKAPGCRKHSRDRQRQSAKRYCPHIDFETALGITASTAERGVQTPAAAGASTPAAIAEPSTTESGTPPVEVPESSVGSEFFAKTSFWNTPLQPKAEIDPQSEIIASKFVTEVRRQIEERRGPTINTTAYSVPIYTVPADQPTVRVTLTRDAPRLQQAFDNVPLPADAHPAKGTDGHLVLWQPPTDQLWEFWRLSSANGEWTTSWGGAMEHVSDSEGVYGPSAWAGASKYWGASGSSLSIAGGLITLQDLSRGTINHALAIAAPSVRASQFTWPAQRTDGVSLDPAAIPEGARLRLDPSLDLATLHLPRLAMMVSQAAQRYGIIVRDNAPGGITSFFAQDPTQSGQNPFTGPLGYFEGIYPTEVLKSFPWEHLELLKMQLQENP